MLIIVMISGLLLGSIINALADYLPHYASEPPVDLPRPRWQIALFSFWRAGQPADKRLRVLVEVSISLLWGYSWLTADSLMAFILMSGIGSFLILIALIDWKYRLVLNVVVYPAIVMTFLLAVLVNPQQMQIALIGGAFAFGIFAAVALLKPGDLGGGDVKLAALLGLLFGFPAVLWVLLLGGGSGALVAVYRLRQPLADRTMPYAPFLCLGALIVLLFFTF